MNTFPASPLALSSKEASAMTFYEMNAERSPIADGLLAKISHRFKSGIRAMQYGRMLQALSQLTDEQLENIGLDRADIPRHARECIDGRTV